MFAELAKHDIARLRKSGYEISDDEIIALNDLAVQIESGKATTVANHPRFASAGNIVLHEPTVGALEWWWSYGRDAAWTSKGQLRTHFFMLAHSRDVDLLNSLQRPSAINRAVRAWLKGVAATDDEMLRAMMYVKHGLNWTLPTEKVEPPDAGRRLDRLYTLLAVVAGQSGIKLEDLKTQTETQLMHLLSFCGKAGLPLKPSVAGLYIKYQALVRSIEKKGVKSDGGSR